MKVLITGSSGFIGQALLPKLKEKYKIYELMSDLTNHLDVETEVNSIKPDIIVHLAARTEVEKSFYEQISFSEINYIGTVNLIESAKTVKNLKNFVFASTMEVYGWQPISDEIQYSGMYTERVTFDENTIPNPNAPYAVAKYGCEKYLEYAHRSLSLPFTAIRQTNAYGRADNNFFVTEAIISRMLQNPNEINMGYAKPWRNFIYVEDLIDAWMAVIDNWDVVNTGKIFTIGPDNAISIQNYVEKIAKRLNWQGKINWNKQPIRDGEIYWLNSNHNLITKLLGWEPKFSLDEGLYKTIEIWKNKLKEKQ